MIPGERVRLRPATATDVVQFAEILAHPEIARWWGDPEEQLREVLDPPDDISSFAIEYDGTTVGIIQCAEERTPQLRHAGIDIALHPDWRGRGLGTDAIQALARYLVVERGHHRLTMDPPAHNEAAIRVYCRLGFKPVGLMRQYERGPDGRWHDSLLMDVLADELMPQ